MLRSKKPSLVPENMFHNKATPKDKLSASGKSTGSAGQYLALAEHSSIDYSTLTIKTSFFF